MNSDEQHASVCSCGKCRDYPLGTLVGTLTGAFLPPDSEALRAVMRAPARLDGKVKAD